MTTGQSTGLEDGLFNNEAVFHALQSCEDAFRAGDREALFRVIAICAQCQAVIPVWAAEEILAADSALKQGEITDFNKIFRSELANKRWRKREARIKAHTNDVLCKLMKYRCDGGAMNAEEAFGEISESTGLPRRDVEEIYRRSGRWVKEIPKGNPGGGSRGFSLCEIPKLR